MSATVSFEPHDRWHPRSDAVIREGVVVFETQPKSPRAAIVEARKHLPDFGAPYTGELIGHKPPSSYRLVSFTLLPLSLTGYDLRCYYEPSADEDE